MNINIFHVPGGKGRGYSVHGKLQNFRDITYYVAKLNVLLQGQGNKNIIHYPEWKSKPQLPRLHLEV